MMNGLVSSRKNNRELGFNPFREMEEFERRFFDTPFSTFFRGTDLAAFTTDITDKGDHYLLEADLPGFDKNDIDLSIDGDRLTISAERHSSFEDKDEKDNYLRCERSFGQYSRSFDISEIESDGITAKLENGVLSLTLPKKPEVKPTSRKLEIR